MKTKNLILFFGILLLFVGCSDNDDKSESDSAAALIGHKWKLTAFVDVVNGTVKAPEPASEDCYWLIFKDDNTLSGKSSTNYLGGSYDVDYKAATIQITNIVGTEINELFDGQLYIERLLPVRHLDIKETSLKLYQDEKNYLLFSIEDKYDLKNNLIGEWVEISPCDHCHTVSFLENDIISEKWTMDEIIYTSSYRIMADDSIQIVRHWETNPDKKITNNKIIFYSNDSILIEKFTLSDAAVFPPEFIDIKLSKTKKP